MTAAYDYLRRNHYKGDGMGKSDFKSVNWGSDEAKGDDDLAHYFVKPPEYDEIFSGKKRYVVGRKGTGKSAVIQRLRLQAESEPLAFFSDMTLRDFPLHDLRDLGDKSQRDKSKYTPIWQFLIYVELIKQAARDHGAEGAEEIDELKSFLTLNNLESEVGFIHTVKELRKRNSKLKILAKWIEGEAGSEKGEESVINVHYNKVVKAIEGKLLTVNSESRYWLFIDELDEGFRAGDQSFRLLLLALIRAVEDSSIQLRRASFQYRPVLVLRSDIFDRLEDNDLNKLDDYIIRLRWTSAADHVQNSLKRIITERIRSSGGNPDDPWGCVVFDNDPDLPRSVDSVWQYAANRTYERPRDIVKFMKYCAKHAEAGKQLTFKQAKAAEDEYSAWLYKELKDEIHSYLPAWKSALDAITRIGTGKFSCTDLENELSTDTTISTWVNEHGKSINDVMETLFDFGVIGNLDENGRWLFKYKDEDLSWNSKMDVIVHFGLNKKLKLIKRSSRRT